MSDTKPENRAHILRWTAIAFLALCHFAGANWSAILNEPHREASTPHTSEPDHIWVTLKGHTEPATTPGGAHNDLLQRLREGFELDQAMNKRVQAEMNLPLGNTTRFSFCSSELPSGKFSHACTGSDTECS